jgi:hypothetical protein
MPTIETYLELKIVVEYDYDPGDKETRDCPGSDPCCEITSVKLADGHELKLDEKQMETLEQECMDGVQSTYEAALESKVEARAEEREYWRLHPPGGDE